VDNELKPCPFCGCEAILRERNTISPYKWEVTCDGQECDVFPQTDTHETPEPAIAAWNTRKGESQ